MWIDSNWNYCTDLQFNVSQVQKAKPNNFRRSKSCVVNVTFDSQFFKKFAIFYKLQKTLIEQFVFETNYSNTICEVDTAAS